MTPGPEKMFPAHCQSDSLGPGGLTSPPPLLPPPSQNSPNSGTTCHGVEIWTSVCPLRMLLTLLQWTKTLKITSCVLRQKKSCFITMPSVSELLIIPSLL